MEPRQVAALVSAEVRRLTARMQRADAEDLVQEAIVRFYSRCGEQKIEDLQGFIRRIVRNLLIDQTRFFRTVSGRPPVFLADEELAQIADSAPRADDVLMAQQAFGAAMSVLSRLSERERIAYLAHVLDGQTVREVADLYTTPKSTMAGQFERVRASLRPVATQHGYSVGAQ